MEIKKANKKKIKFKDLTLEDKILRIYNIIRKIIGIFIIGYGIYGGVMLSFVALTGIASASHQAVLAYIVQFIVMAIMIGLSSFVGLWIFGVKKKPRIISSCSIFAGIYIVVLTLLSLVFYMPVKNTSVYLNNSDTYFELSTRSKISYQKYSNEVTEEYPIVFLHGGAGAPVNGKEELVDDLVESGYIVYQYDQFGSGNSSRASNPSEYTVKRQVEDLEEIRKQIGTSKMILISHSWGGTLASNYMAKYPDNVANSIFISPARIWSGDETIKGRTTEGQKDVNSAMNKNLRYFFTKILSSVGPSTGLYYLMPEKNLDALFMNFHDSLNMKPGSGKYYNTVAANYGYWANTMISNNLDKQECPYQTLQNVTSNNLVIKGEYDYISWEATRQYRDIIPNTKMITIDGMCHSIEDENKEIISENIILFLKTGNTLKKTYVGQEFPW